MCIAAAAVSDGAHYIAADGGADGIEFAAFRSNDGGYGLVVMNTSGSERRLRVSDRTNRFVVTIPAHSLASYRW